MLNITKRIGIKKIIFFSITFYYIACVAVALACPPCNWGAGLCCDSYGEARAECANYQSQHTPPNCTPDCSDSGPEGSTVVFSVTCDPPPTQYPAMPLWRYPQGPCGKKVINGILYCCAGDDDPCCGKPINDPCCKNPESCVCEQPGDSAGGPN
jgi:hypothetical protein